MFVYIPGELIALMSFPGVIIHEVGHRFFCDLFKIPVYDVRYFVPFSKAAGCVIHGQTQDLKSNFFIAIGPLIVNTLLAILLLLPVAYYHTIFDYDIPEYTKRSINFMTWLGFSICMNALPSSTDLEHVEDILHDDQHKKLIYMPLTMITYFLQLCAYANTICGIFYAYGMSKLLIIIMNHITA